MQNLFIALAFIAMVLAPCFAALGKTTVED